MEEEGVGGGESRDVVCVLYVLGGSRDVVFPSSLGGGVGVSRDVVFPTPWGGSRDVVFPSPLGGWGHVMLCSQPHWLGVR